MTTHPRFALLVLASLALAASACRPPVFLPEFQVNTSDPGYNFADDVAMSERGDFIVTWAESTTDVEVFGRRFDASTAPLDAPFPVSANTAPDRESSSIARDASGRFVMVWREGQNEIRGRRWDSDGTPLGADFPINASTTAVASGPHVACDRSGNFVVTWTSAGADAEALARRFDSQGAPLGDEFAVNDYTTGDQSPSGVAVSASGFVVTWFGEGAGGNGVFGRRFDASGAPVTGDLQVNTDALVDDDLHPDVAMNAAGDFVVVWHDKSGFYSEALGRRYASAGTPAGDVFPISDGSGVAGVDPRVASDSAGNFIVTWSSIPVVAPEGGGTDASAVRARLYDIGGTAVSAEFVVNEITTAVQFGGRPSIAHDGSFVVAFSSGTTFVSDVKGRKSGVRAAPVISVDPPLAAPTGNSNGNRVFEPGETVTPRTAWVNDTADDVLTVSGSSPLFTGPPGADYTLGDDTATYDTIAAGQTKSCILAPDCYLVTVSNPAVRPAQHWDAVLQETLNLSLPHSWVLHIGRSFPDVPDDHPFYSYVETLFHQGITGGCAGGTDYCPAGAVTRAQMAVFLLKSKFGSAHVPPPCTGTVFNDVPCSGGPFDPWIEELASLQITGGCGGGSYCPTATVTRQQMAVFLLKAFEGSSYDPPDCTGVFDDVPCTPGTGFSDWIEELAARNITGGCSVTPPLFCPTDPNNRGQMAAFLVKTFGLVLYGG